MRGLSCVSCRDALLREFERAGVGVSVMKPFAGGQLFDAARSPFGRALTRTQCIQYALDRPGVLTVLPGVRGEADLRDLLSYLDAMPEERDYSVLADMAPQSREARCVYCNHCQPCPAGIQIGLVNKYYDLALVGVSWRRSTTATSSTMRASASAAGTATAAARSGWRSPSAWGGSRSTSACRYMASAARGAACVPPPSAGGVPDDGRRVLPVPAHSENLI